MFKRIGILVLLVLGLAIAPVIHAQDAPAATPEPTAEATPVPTAEPPIIPVEPPAPVAPVFTPPALPDAIQAFLAALVAIFAAALASPLTAPLVSLVKRIPGLDKYSGEVINLAVAVLLSAILWIGQALGLVGQIDTAYRLIYLLLPFLSGIGSNFVSNQAVYQFGVRQNMPIIGFQRTPSTGIDPNLGSHA